jgi:hypothetical protein
MNALTRINPFLAARRRLIHDPRPRAEVPRPHRRRLWAKLPIAPVNGSPVPHLTSLYHHDEAGPYGSRSYPGNCGGNLIKDLLRYFRPRRVFDPMTGSGTCRDVCRELGVACVSSDIHAGFDAANAEHVGQLAEDGLFDFVWAHPPYWRQKLYAADDRDLSRAPTLAVFLDRYEAFIRNCAGVLADGGRLAILIGDYSDRDRGFIPLTYYTKEIAFRAGLLQCCTDIVRFSHGASSGRKVYRSSFIPGLHDLCMVFQKTSG